MKRKKTATLRIALVQMRSEKGAVHLNLKKMQHYIDLATTSGADVIAFPELSIPGYIVPMEYPRSVFSASSSSTMRAFYAATRQKNIVVIAGFAERAADNKQYISQAVVANGKLLGVYRKRNINAEEKPGYTASTASPIFKTLTHIPFGVAICADIAQAEIFRDAAKQGAKIVFHCSAPDLWKRRRSDAHWVQGYDWWRGECDAHLARYARQNKIYIAATTQCGRTKDEDYPGGMYIYDPQGRCIVQSNDYHESSLITTLEIG